MKGLLGWRRINMVEILDSDARCKLTTEKVRLIYLPHISAASTQSVIFTIALQTTKRVNSPPLHTHTHRSILYSYTHTNTYKHLPPHTQTHTEIQRTCFNVSKMNRYRLKKTNSRVKSYLWPNNL